MPKPEGWTEGMVKKRDEIAKTIMKKRKLKKKNAYAIATYIINKRREKAGGK